MNAVRTQNVSFAKKVFYFLLYKRTRSYAVTGQNKNVASTDSSIKKFLIGGPYVCITHIRGYSFRNYESVAVERVSRIYIFRIVSNYRYSSTVRTYTAGRGLCLFSESCRFAVGGTKIFEG